MNWPANCHDPDSCYRHMNCMYIQCPWRGTNNKELMKAMLDAKARDAREKDLK